MAAAAKPVEVDTSHPRYTSDLTGHEEAQEALATAIESGRLAHAWLLSGPRGIGKATLAYWFARQVLAIGGNGAGQGGLLGDTGAPPGAGRAEDPQSDVFRRVASGGHAGLRVLEREPDPKSKVGRIRDTIVVDQVRRLIPFFGTTEAAGGYRVALVDAADELNINGQNALLKLLEEPPHKALIILVSHSPGRLLPTVRSRCRKMALAPLSADVAATILSRRLMDVSAEDQAALARLAEGSPGRALALANAGGIDLYREMMDLLTPLPGLEGFSGKN